MDSENLPLEMRWWLKSQPEEELQGQKTIPELPAVKIIPKFEGRPYLQPGVAWAPAKGNQKKQQTAGATLNFLLHTCMNI